jgi:hypothetical protein
LLAWRIRWFVAATISFDVIEAIIALTEGTRVSSTALIGYRSQAAAGRTLEGAVAE